MLDVYFVIQKRQKVGDVMSKQNKIPFVRRNTIEMKIVSYSINLQTFFYKFLFIIRTFTISYRKRIKNLTIHSIFKVKIKRI